MSITFRSSLFILLAVALFAASPKHVDSPEIWHTKAGVFRLVNTENRNAILYQNNRQLRKFDIPGFLRASFRPDGPPGCELFLLQLNAADSSWFHIIEITQGGKHLISPMFGNGGDLPSILDTSSALEFSFETLDLPRGKVAAQTWRYENHALRQIK